MSIADERDLSERLSGVLDVITPPEAPVSAAVRKGKIIQARRSLVIVAGLAVVAGLGVSTPALLHQAGRQAMSRAKPTVMVQQICPYVARGIRAAGRQPDVVTLRAAKPSAGGLPAAELAAGGCAWLEP